MRASAAAVLLMVAACAPAYPTVVPSTPAQAQAPEPTLTQPQALPTSPPSAPLLRSPIPQPTASDQCGAAQAQALVGRPRTLIPVPVDPRRQRVACTTCPVTEDFDPTRLNFLFDAQSGLIRQVRCG